MHISGYRMNSLGDMKPLTPAYAGCAQAGTRSWYGEKAWRKIPRDFRAIYARCLDEPCLAGRGDVNFGHHSSEAVN